MIEHEPELDELIRADMEVTHAIHYIVKSINGVCGFHVGFAKTISRSILGSDPLSKGIKIYRNEEKLSAEIHVIIEYGKKIPQLAWEIQTKVKNRLQKNFDIKIEKVDVHIDGIQSAEEE